ncbi:type II toxin-antitoxin system HicB family antitoxin [Tianweitania sp. BSSL-BM11]|uniref:Type II toxin-antitoxin system HicB family antitoxin n=1 Tax=Tianweitania aestuarii TaxID=2814886 RepID=A0ABS5RZ59_9HYPH|nr:type II toxin-antitoxin system HicB family antitoxin [Tianweitania aestuarii]MBS9722340.1 type II toxin-antitoxin system HicB family antitoxin [Tianweitania aestuarii]
MIDNARRLVTADGSIFDPAAYEIVLRPLDAEEGNGWLATIPALPGCTGDGESEITAIADVRSAALEWAEAAIHDGDIIPNATHHPIAAE